MDSEGTGWWLVANGDSGDAGDMGMPSLVFRGVISRSTLLLLGVVGLEIGGVGGMLPMMSASVWTASMSIVTADSADMDVMSQFSSRSTRGLSLSCPEPLVS